jgi:hypothetical protein
VVINGDVFGLLYLTNYSRAGGHHHRDHGHSPSMAASVYFQFSKGPAPRPLPAMAHGVPDKMGFARADDGKRR